MSAGKTNPNHPIPSPAIRACFIVIIKVPQVFELVQEFVSEVAPTSSGRLLLLNGEPGGGMFCLEPDRRVSFGFSVCGLLSGAIVGIVLCAPFPGRIHNIFLAQQCEME